ncbi:MAG: tyrosine-protein phosphatase [Pseudomonadota bacterium]
MDSQIGKVLATLARETGSFVIGPRPGKKSVGTLKDLKLTHCCTLLSEREDVRPIQKICNNLGCTWIWLPIEGGRLEILQETDLEGHVETLARALGAEAAPRVYFHCSAGIHRTGFFVYVLLRLGGLEPDRARQRLADLRPVTAEQVGAERLQLADEIVETLAHGF